MIETATATDAGLARSHNEDAVYTFQYGDFTLLIVADGMGGHQAGEVASALAIETISSHLVALLQTDGATSIDIGSELKAAIALANEEILAYSDRHTDEADNLGTTIVVALLRGSEGVVANVGDSRAYRLHADALTQITNDHSYVGELVRVGILKPADVFDHPRRSLITRSLGADDTVDLFDVALMTGDWLLLCSDGLWEMVRDSAEIATIMHQADTVDVAAQQLIARANHYGGEDNIGVALAKVAA